MKNLLPCLILATVLFSCKKADIVNPNTPDVVYGRDAGGSSGGTDDIFSCTTCSVTPPITINSNFNGTPIEGGDYLWFNVHIKINNASGIALPLTLGMTNSEVSFTASGVSYDVPVPNAQITVSPSAASATTTWTGTYWNTIIPASQISNGEIFLTGLALQVPAGGFPGGLNPVGITSNFISSTPGISLQWQWSAAVYNNFPSNYNDAGVVVVHTSQHAGTPWNYRSYVTGGGRGGGGSNYTGSWSATGSASF